ncbi:MAG: SIS domain-containing protein [Tannerellaceae bacterium]|jgi:D-sedoheptulose 7-phosphate isomerase|nr:SIS domain-containing protein [Tannerellaceae bacterium]
MKESARKEFELIFTHFPELSVCRETILSAFGYMLACYRSGGMIMTCGNGGSASDAEHIVGELMKGFKLKRPITPRQRQSLEEAFPEEGGYLAGHLQGAIPAISLVSQSAFSSAFINDVAPDMAFAQQVFAYGKAGSLLIALSTSGNSPNVANACKVAKALHLKTIALTGDQGGILAALCDVAITVPATETYRIQEYHLPIYHTLCAMLEKEVFGSQTS